LVGKHRLTWTLLLLCLGEALLAIFC
jgi:hypothetical protein